METRSSPELTLVIPTFNERDNIAPLVAAVGTALAGVEWEILFVDDNSRDGTPDEIRRVSHEDPRVRCIRRLSRKGLASACMDGMFNSEAPYLAVMDADLQHDENILPAMLDALRNDDADIAIGTRYAGAGSTGALSGSRVRISRFATWLANLVLPIKISDPMSGFFMLNREIFEQAKSKLSGKGFKILLDFLTSAPGEIRVQEFPYTMRSRALGESKLSPVVVWEYFMLLADKLLGRLLPPRFLLFSLVGLTGVGVHLALLSLLHYGFNQPFFPAQAVATLVAMTSNFFLNNYFTYSDRPARGKAIISALISFYLACSIGAVINLELADAMYLRQFPWWIAGVSGAFVAAVWNYAATSIVTWRGIPARQRPR
jgi:dolichol-phosphate mannosyltransferase